jgi:rifampicin phosphotransferase
MTSLIFSGAEDESGADRVVWSNVNTAEVLPDVVTPMSWSVLQPVIQSLFSGFMTNLGMNVEGYTFFDRVAGRAYANLNTVMGAIRHIPGMRGRGITEVFGGQQGATEDLDAIHIADEDIPDLDFSVWQMLVRMPRFLFQVLTYRPKRGDRILARLRERSSALLTEDLGALPSRELADRAGRAIGILVEDAEMYEVTGVGVLWEQVLFDNGKKWLGEGANPLIGACLAGLGNNANANAGLVLWRLAVIAHEEPAVARALGGAVAFADLRAQLMGEPGGGRFVEAWDGFMAEHGHHARGELELMNPRWSEQPEETLDQVRSYIDALGSHDFQGQFEGLVEGREAAEREIRSRLRNPVKRWLFGYLLRKARTCSPIRENLKNEMVRQLAGVRRVLLELGRRAAARGAVGHPDDVFFLAMDELPSMAGGEEVLSRIVRRRARYERDLTLRPPPIVVGRFDPARHVVEEAIDPDLRTLEGFGVNPGTATGPARVILRAGVGKVQPGEILVAPFTDPGWTPYFLNAAAIVMDQGGLLSHGSIVAREFGIPAVVNVGPATSIIETGQLLRVDGARGTVTILEES